MYGEKERMPFDSKIYQDALDEKGAPRINCRDKNTMLDLAGCLNADGKIAKHCVVRENFRPLADDISDPCSEGWKKNYMCYDYAICTKDESSSVNTKKKNSGETQGTK